MAPALQAALGMTGGASGTGFIKPDRKLLISAMMTSLASPGVGSSRQLKEEDDVTTDRSERGGNGCDKGTKNGLGKESYAGKGNCQREPQCPTSTVSLMMRT